MKKIMSLTVIFIILSFIILTGKSLALSLDTLDVSIDKTTVRPGETVKLTIEFGKELGAYTFNVTYDNNIFEYVSAEGGTPNDTSDKVKVVYHDSSGGTNPRTSMSVTFKAKENIITSNPTEFTVTAEGLSNKDASETYDDILVPIAKNLTVEPEYTDYNINLEYTGEIRANEEKEMTISYSSKMGKSYEHARLIAEAKTPENANVKLLGIDDASLEHDIIQSGWGDPQGYKIGGKDVSQVLKVRGLFTKEGDYTITLKLIDRDNSDTVIAEKEFSFKVAEELDIVPPVQEDFDSSLESAESFDSNEVTNDSTNIAENNSTEDNSIENNNSVKNTTENLPSSLPKTGNNMYLLALPIIALLAVVYIYSKKSK